MDKEQSPIQDIMTVTRFACTSCKNPVITRVPVFRVVNQPEFSSVTCVHQVPVKCNSCDTFFIPVIKGIDNNMKLLVNWKTVQVAQPNSVKDEVPEQAVVKQ